MNTASLMTFSPQAGAAVRNQTPRMVTKADASSAGMGKETFGDVLGKAGEEAQKAMAKSPAEAQGGAVEARDAKINDDMPEGTEALPRETGKRGEGAPQGKQPQQAGDVKESEERTPDPQEPGMAPAAVMAFSTEGNARLIMEDVPEAEEIPVSPNLQSLLPQSSEDAQKNKNFLAMLSGQQIRTQNPGKEEGRPAIRNTPLVQVNASSQGELQLQPKIQTQPLTANLLFKQMGMQPVEDGAAAKANTLLEIQLGNHRLANQLVHAPVQEAAGSVTAANVNTDLSGKTAGTLPEMTPNQMVNLSDNGKDTVLNAKGMALFQQSKVTMPSRPVGEVMNRTDLSQVSTARVWQPEQAGTGVAAENELFAGVEVTVDAAAAKTRLRPQPITAQVEAKTVGEAVTKTESAAQIESAAEMVPAAKMKSAAETVPAAKMESTAETVPAAKMESTVETVPAAKMESTAESVPAAKMESTAETVLAAKMESTAETVPAAKMESAAETVPAAKMKSAAETVPAAKMEFTAETVPAAKMESTVETVPAAKMESTAETMPAAKVESAAKTVPVTETAAKVVPGELTGLVTEPAGEQGHRPVFLNNRQETAADYPEPQTVNSRQEAIPPVVNSRQDRGELPLASHLPEAGQQVQRNAVEPRMRIAAESAEPAASVEQAAFIRPADKTQESRGPVLEPQAVAANEELPEIVPSSQGSDAQQMGNRQQQNARQQVPVTPLPVEDVVDSEGQAVQQLAEEADGDKAPAPKQQEPANGPVSAFRQDLADSIRGTERQQEVPGTRDVQDNFQVARQIIEQARLIRRAENTEMVIKLHPDHLGELTLKVSVSANGAVNASFHSDNAQVRTIIENSLVQLKQELSNQGLKVDNVDVYAGLNDGQLPQGEGQQAWQQNQSHNSGNAGNFTGNLEDYGEDTESAATMQQADTAAADGVDYRV